jgi:predicted O-methyltransferase YrrM
MPAILEKRIEKYLDRLLPTRDALLTEMEKYAKRREIPIIGPACGRLLYLLARISGAKRMLEMGSAIGYSTIWLARGAGAEAEIYYTDGDPENARRARDYFRRGGVEDRIQLLVGDAVELMDGISGDFDLIFIDVDKEQYPDALRKAVPRLRTGGLLITDNALWYGRAARPAKDARTRAIQQFNKLIYSSRELFPVIVPLRDGVAVCRKA